MAFMFIMLNAKKFNETSDDRESKNIVS